MTTQPYLNHIAIIPDGNRRWAKKHSIFGDGNIYQKGSDKTFEIIDAALRLQVPYVTFWASSYSNLANRPAGFVKATEKMYEQKFLELANNKSIHDNQIKINIFGQWKELLEEPAQKSLQLAIDSTANYNKQTLTVLVGYDGQRERAAAVTSLLKDQGLDVSQDGNKLLRDHAWTGFLPDVDLVIRTGAWEDPHNSAAFLSLLTNESQLAFPKVLWPDFTPQLLKEIVEDYQKRERRLGK